MDKRYQVFISSTYADLQEERQEVMQALLERDLLSGAVRRPRPPGAVCSIRRDRQPRATTPTNPHNAGRSPRA